jgi:UDPglucose 6-dehydrogenase
MNIGIIGHGFVGKALEYGLQNNLTDKKYSVYVYDKYEKLSSMAEVVEKCVYLFICVPTPFNEESDSIDLSILHNVIQEIDDISETSKTIIIKSTVVPGTVNILATKYHRHTFIFNPEFLTEKNYVDDFINPDRVVLGGNSKEALYFLTDLYKDICGTDVPIFKMSFEEAEIVKYQCNAMLAMKVGMSNLFYDLCSMFGGNYDNVLKGVTTDPRIGGSHMTIKLNRGFGGKCFPKDVAAIHSVIKDCGIDCNLLSELLRYNANIRHFHDWKEIEGAFS